MSKMSIGRYLAVPFLLPALAAAASSFATPITGYVAESSGSVLRSVLGLPGALSFSDPLPLPEGTTRVRVPSSADFAWVERADQAPAVLLLKAGAADRLTPVDGALGTADWMAFSSRGASAVAYSASAGRLQLITGLP